MAETILFVFEGQKTEPQILSNLKKHYFNNARGTIIQATFNTDIYTLWKKVNSNKFQDVLEIVRNISNENRETLINTTRGNVSEIYLFFDYDGHSPVASDIDIEKMLAHFDNETEQGKLYISYPMVEALKHIKKEVDFSQTLFEVKKGTDYKNCVHHSTDYRDITQLDITDWNYIIAENHKKANLIVNDAYIQKPEPNELTKNLEQNCIFDSQLKKYIEPHGKVAVLSPFPLFIIEYFGENVVAKT